MTPLRIAVIGGGQNVEHEVSLASAASILSALDPVRYTGVPLTISRDGRWMDATGREIGIGAAIELLCGCAVAFPAVHGRRGEDGVLAALLETAGVRYVGSGVAAGAIGMDKHITKVIAASVGVATASAVLLDRVSARSYRFSGPVVVKPVASGSSLGVSLVSAAAGLPRAFEAAFAADDGVLVEEVITGREIDIAVMRRADGNLLVSPALEIDAGGFFDHDAKYNGEAVFHVPAPIDESVRSSLAEAAVRMYEALGCSGVARIDFFVTAAGPVLIEVNTMPGFTAQSQVPRMFEAAGISYGELLDLLIQDALAA